MKYLALLAALMPTTLLAQNFERSFDDWEFSRDGDYCNAGVSSYGLDSRFEWGTEGGRVFVFVITKLPFAMGLTELGDYKVTLRFDDESSLNAGDFKLVGRRYSEDGRRELLSFFMAKEPRQMFDRRIMSKNTVDITIAGNYVGGFSLSGSGRAQRALMECGMR